MAHHLRHTIFYLLLLATVGLTLVCGWTSSWWIGTTFPGFFVMDNRVVASISLPHWPVAAHAEVYQQQVVAVNGQPVTTSAALYAQIRRLPAGAPVTYTLEQHGQRSEVTLPAYLFTAKDWSLLFGAYFVNGVAIALIGLATWYWSSTAPTGSALLSLSLTMALFIVTAADLYAPHWFFRNHILGEAFFPAAAVHLALVFPRERLRHARAFYLALPYGVAGLSGLSYEVFLYQPAAYSQIHNLCTVYAGLAGCCLIGKMVWDYGSMASLDIRRKIRVVVLGCLSGYGFPTVLMLAAGLQGGQCAVNYAAFTLFVFPLSIGYVLIKQDLLRTEMMLRRGISCLIFLALTALLWGGRSSDARAFVSPKEHGEITLSTNSDAAVAKSYNGITEIDKNVPPGIR
jgi:hypothetical protein